MYNTYIYKIVIRNGSKHMPPNPVWVKTKILAQPRNQCCWITSLFFCIFLSSNRFPPLPTASRQGSQRKTALVRASDAFTPASGVVARIS